MLERYSDKMIVLPGIFTRQSSKPDRYNEEPCRMQRGILAFSA
jgi:hypothetical protein